VDAEVVRLPLLAQRVERDGRLSVPGGRERAPLVVEPVERRLVGAVPGQLVEHE
jgi:hypothetical protein